MRHYRPRAIWQVVLADILIGALALGLVVFFQLGLPILQARGRGQSFLSPIPEERPAALSGTETPPLPADPQQNGSAAQDPAPPEQAEETPEQAETGSEPAAPTPTPDTRTEWQIRFADQFTDQVVITDTSYTSPQVSIHIETREFGEGWQKSVYHVADIYVASLDNFRTYTAHNELAYWSTQDPMEMDRDSHAILTISGDFYSYQPKGFLVRNGELYMSDQTYCDLCVLYNSGVMACYGRTEYEVEDIWSRGVAQAWNFGPSLLDAEGHVKPDYELSTAVSYPNPRSAVGYYEPGHYCFVLVDGRQDGYSRGMTIPELASVFEDLGCTCAYNLDGGGSALMTFLHQRFSRQSNGAGRDLGDMLIITEEGWEANR